jgi:deoxyribonuclease IV
LLAAPNYGRISSRRILVFDFYPFIQYREDNILSLLTLGVHVSIAGKIYKAADRAKELGCNTMQIFSRNPRQWRKALLSDEDLNEFHRKVSHNNIDPVVIHIPYTLNLASNKHSFYKTTIGEFIIDLQEADRLRAQYLVTHIGSFKGSTEKNGLLRVVNALKKILKETEGVKTKILLENTSGSGHWLGSTFNHHRFILNECAWHPGLGVCLDTAHAWAAGYKIDSPAGVTRMIDEIDKEVSMERVKVVHLNDTKEPLGSRQDRHAGIGEGSIGKNGFKALVNHPKLKGAAFILETPKESQADDLRNLKIVRSLHSQ